jgi:hypothetical protein
MRRQLGKFASRIRFRLQYLNHQGKTPLRQIAKARPFRGRAASDLASQHRLRTAGDSIRWRTRTSPRLQSCSPTLALPPVRNHGSAHNWFNTLNAGASFGAVSAGMRRDRRPGR